jgi:hypothetical protein
VESDKTCNCGHLEEEHEEEGFFKRCTIEECDCDDFEEADE